MSENEQKYRKALKLSLWLFILWIPVVFSVTIGLYKLLGTFVPGYVFAFVWMAAWAIAGGRAVVFRYRCKRPN